MLRRPLRRRCVVPGQACERSAQLSVAFQRASYLEVLLLHSNAHAERQVAQWVSLIRAGKRDISVARSLLLEPVKAGDSREGIAVVPASDGAVMVGVGADRRRAVDASALVKPYLDILQRSLEVAVETIVACIETLTALTTTFQNGEVRGIGQRCSRCLLDTRTPLTTHSSRMVNLTVS